MQKLNFSNYFLAEADKATHVMTFMRANPPTIGHERVVNHVMDLAKNFDAGHSIVLSHSFDGDKNPLTAEQKLRHAKLAFPGSNVSTSSPESPSLLYHASDLHKKGVKNLHLVVGQDRVDQFQQLLSKYNGQEGTHGYFNFDNISVHSAGGRDPDAEGIEGVSGTSQRKHARSGNFENFRAGAPSRMSDEQAASLMNDIRNAQPPVKPKKSKNKPKAEPFNPGTPVYVEHGSNAAKSIKESTRLSFRQLLEKTKGPSYQDFIDDPDYQRTKRSVLSSLNNANEHISKGGPDAVHGALDKHYDLSSNPHSEHFDYYSDVDASYPINSSLFHHHNEGGDPNELPDEDINDISHDDIRGLDKALAHKKTPKPMTVFSGVGFNPGMMAAKHPKNQLYMPSYTSTSIDPKVAADFAKPLSKGDSGEKLTRYNPSDSEGADHHVLRINLPKGQQGSYIAGSSNFPEEKEFLLPRQQTMKIDPTPEVHEFEHNGVTHRMHIWNATPTPTKLPKPVTEQVTTADARGFGYVTGDPAVNSSVTTNDVDATFFRGNLKNSIKQSENPLAKLLGFRAFDPDKMNFRDKTLSYYEADPNGDPLKTRKKK
jgi:hypothetical protein